MHAYPGSPVGLPGLDERFRRYLTVPAGHMSSSHRWHYLDSGVGLSQLDLAPVGTVLAVHGNPTWSYLWRDLVSASVAAAAKGAPPWRVIAVDLLDMGFSERAARALPLARRVADLEDFTHALALDGPVVTLGHDWGGLISLGWAVDHPDLVAGVVAMNTAVIAPTGKLLPAALRVASVSGTLLAVSVTTPGFVKAALSLARPALPPEVRAAYRAPYASAARRQGIGRFVADVPANPAHPSRPELDRIARGVAGLDVPALLLWGPEDPVFPDLYLDDLVDRLPQAQVHRFEGAGHLVGEDRACAGAILAWLGDNVERLTTPQPAPPEPHLERAEISQSGPFAPLWAALEARRDDGDVAVVDMSARAQPRVTWRQLHRRVHALAAGLARIGVRPGHRVSVLVPPGPTLTALVYACLRIGAVVVVADSGLGVSGLSRAVRGAQPDVIVGGVRGLAAARALRWPGMRISTVRLPRATTRALGIQYDLASIADSMPDAAPLVPEPAPDDTAAILFTSGSTGPAKGVVYTHRQLAALRDVLAEHFDVTRDTGLVTGFAPFALLGPALGTRSTTPDMDVSAPRTLTAAAIAAAVRASDAQIVFLSPAALLNVVATADALTDADRRVLATVRTFLSTGAPVGEPLLAAAARLMPNADAHTPYGMTECLLVTDVTLEDIRAVVDAVDRGVCVGRPIGTNRVLISALDADGAATGIPSTAPHVLGEVVVSARHLKTSYDRLWLTDRDAVRETPTDGRWHRTGDLGHLDASGRLWIEGRLPHVIVTADGPVAPVGPEQDVERADGVRRAAIVGVGPHRMRQAVAVVESVAGVRAPGLATPALTAEIRRGSALPLAAVLVVPRLPTDIRHNSKIDRTRLSSWAERTLGGGRITRP